MPHATIWVSDASKNTGIAQMDPTPLPKVIDIFYSTVSQLEAAPGFQQGDAAVLELRHRILRTIADLEELRKSPQTWSNVTPTALGEFEVE